MTLEEVKDLISIQVPLNEPGFSLNGRVWTRSSESLIWKDCATYCLVRGTNLQTLDDAVEFRVDSGGAGRSDGSQHTRTLIGYVNDGAAGLRAFIFEPDIEQLKGWIENPQMFGKWLTVSVQDALARQVMEGARGRTFIVPEKDASLSFRAEGDSFSRYGSDEIIKAFMPRNAEKNARYMSAQGQWSGEVWLHRPSLSEGVMIVQPVSLFGNDFGRSGTIDATHVFYGLRPGRGVASAPKSSQ